MQSGLFLLPVDIKAKQPIKWVGFKTYEYKLFSSMDEDALFTYIKFIDIGNIIVGFHIPTELKNSYDRTTQQVKVTAAKAVSEIKIVAADVKDLAGEIVSEMKEDVLKTAKQSVNVAGSIWKKIKDRQSTKSDNIN